MVQAQGGVWNQLGPGTRMAQRDYANLSKKLHSFDLQEEDIPYGIARDEKTFR